MWHGLVSINFANTFLAVGSDRIGSGSGVQTSGSRSRSLSFRRVLIGSRGVMQEGYVYIYIREAKPEVKVCIELRVSESSRLVKAGLIRKLAKELWSSRAWVSEWVRQAAVSHLHIHRTSSKVRWPLSSSNRGKTSDEWVYGVQFPRRRCDAIDRGFPGSTHSNSTSCTAAASRESPSHIYVFISSAAVNIVVINCRELIGGSKNRRLTREACTKSKN